MEQHNRQDVSSITQHSIQQIKISQFISDLQLRDPRNDTSNHSHPRCANCGTPANSRCGGCSASAAAESINRQLTFYCGNICQEQHRHQHRTRCNIVKNLVDVQALRRAVDLLQRMFYVYRQNNFDLHMDQIVHDENILEIWEKAHAVHEIFAESPCERADHLGVPREQILTLGTNFEMMAQLHPLFVLLIRASNIVQDERDIDEVYFNLKPCPQSWILHKLKKTSSSDNAEHCVLRVRLSDKSEWAIDLCGAQFGRTQPLMSWSAYEQQRIAKIERVCGYKMTYWSQTQLTHSWTNIPSDIEEAAFHLKFWTQANAVTAMKENLEVLLQHAGVSTRQLLRDTSPLEFERVSDTILDFVAGNAIVSMGGYGMKAM